MADLSKPSNRRSPTFDAEVLDHFGMLRQMSIRLGRNVAEADDMVQETYVRALRASDGFQPGTNLRAWLLTILKNIARNRRRDEYRSRVRRDEAEMALAADRRMSPEGSPEHALLSQDIEPALQTALESMPKALRDAVWLRDVEEFSYAEIARRLHIPLGTVMSRISRGRRLLHDRLLGSDRGGARL